MTVAVNPRFKAIVFDFDGTLVQSAAAKRQAFFDLLASTPANARIIGEILDANPDGTRFTLIPQMIEAIGAAKGSSPENLIASYGDKVFEAVMAAPEMPGATALLRRLAGRAIITICSSTPHGPLQALAAARGWTRLVDGAFGIPTTKTAHIAGLMSQHRLSPAEVAMVGDGDNDEAAAEANSCAFFRVAGPGDLARVAAQLGGGDVQG